MKLLIQYLDALGLGKGIKDKKMRQVKVIKCVGCSIFMPIEHIIFVNEDESEYKGAHIAEPLCPACLQKKHELRHTKTRIRPTDGREWQIETRFTTSLGHFFFAYVAVIGSTLSTQDKLDQLSHLDKLKIEADIDALLAAQA